MSDAISEKDVLECLAYLFIYLFLYAMVYE